MKYLLLILVAWAGGVHADKIHDPTLPQFKATGASKAPEESDTLNEEIRLQGVLNRKKRKVAIISGQLYNKGDKVNGYLIADIKNDHVLLLSSGSRKRIYVYE